MEELPADHPARLVGDVVNALDLSAIEASNRKGDRLLEPASRANPVGTGWFGRGTRITEGLTPKKKLDAVTVRLDAPNEVDDYCNGSMLAFVLSEPAAHR